MYNSGKLPGSPNFPIAVNPLPQPALFPDEAELLEYFADRFTLIADNLIVGKL